MSPLNLEDVETYLVEQANELGMMIGSAGLKGWLRDKFAELRLREASVLQGPQESHPGS